MNDQTAWTAAVGVISALLSGGTVGGIASIYRAKKLATPERDSIIADASRDTVTSMQIMMDKQEKELTRKDARIAELETAQKTDAERIKQLSKDIADLQAQYATIAGLLAISQQTAARLQRELAALQARPTTT